MSQTPDVFYTGRSFQEEEVKNKTVVVIDILRAGSTIVTALMNGAKSIIPVQDMAEASTIAQNLDPSRYLLCGERDGLKIDGYHLGNSPLEYTRETVEGKTLILNTTNGTRALVRSAGARKVIIGSFLNLSAVLTFLEQESGNVIIVCSGWKYRLSFEDLLCAGAIIHKLNNGVLPDSAPDGACVAFALYDKFGADITKSVHGSNHAERLKSIGALDDIGYCTHSDITDIIPVMDDGMITA